MNAHSNLRSETFEWTGPISGSRLETGMSGLVYLSGIRDGAVAAAPVAVLASAELLEVGPGRVQLICTAADSQFGSSGELDAGVANFLVNAAIDCAAQTLVGLHEGWAVVTSSVAYVRPAAPQVGILFATADGVKLSARRAIVVGDLTDEHGQVLTTATTMLDLFEVN
jgi:acyl-coenzyme A thioesterase PaaI-like protein